MVFDKLADFIIRRHKIIIIAWIIILILAIPLAPNINNVLVYEETQMAPGQMESEKAMKFIENEFGAVMESGTSIIVIKADNALDNETKTVIYSIQKELFNASHDGRIPGDVSAESLYSLLTEYAAGVMMQISDGIEEAEIEANFTSQLLFGIPLEFQDLYWMVNRSAFILYGIPNIHIEIWQEIKSGHPAMNVTEVDAEAFDQTLLALQVDPRVQQMDETMRGLVFLWYNYYIDGWNSTADNATLTSDPPLRAQVAISTSFPALIQSIPAEMHDLFLLLYQSLDLETWGNYHVLNSICDSIFSQEIESQENVSPLDYYRIFYNFWNSSETAPDETGLENIISQSALAFAEFIGGIEGEFILAVSSYFDIHSWNNTEAQKTFSIGVVSLEAETELWLVQLVADLGEDPSPGQIYDLANEVVLNSSVEAFPMPVPEALVENVVNVPENDTTLIMLTFDSGSTADDSVDIVRNIVHQICDSFANIEVYVTGSDAISKDLSEATEDDMDKIDPVSIVLVLVLIGIYFRSVVASSIPPLSIGIAIAVAMSIVYLLGTYLISIHYSVLAVMVTAMLGAGCDYCIFILSRYREERLKGNAKNESVRMAVQWAGEAVTTSGMTVMIGFGALALGRFDMMKSMGIALALGILLALMVALTLLPSILTLVGDRLFWPARLDTNSKKKDPNGRKKKSYFEKSARFAVDHAKAIIIAAILISVPTTYLVMTLDTSYDFIAGMPESESKAGLEVLGEGFGEGRITPTYIAVNFTVEVIEDARFNLTLLDEVENVSSQLLSLPEVGEVISPTRPLGEPINYTNMSQYSPVVRAQYEELMKSMVGKNGTAVLVEVILETEPYARESIDLVDDLREMGYYLTENKPCIEGFYVTGGTAIMYDISEMVQDDFTHMRYFVIVGIYLVLLFVLGSVLIPLRLIITILLSISWTIAVTMLVFIHFVGTPILWLMPMVLFVVCMGLGMDYDILLTTRIREEVLKGKTDRDAVVEAVERTGGIITACGLIMAGAFGTMMLSSTSLLQEFGFALAFAILLDATIVRIYLVPAIMVLLEGYNWWAPGRLQRVRRNEKDLNKRKKE